MRREINPIRILIVVFALLFGAVSGAWALTINDIEIGDVKPSASAGTISKSISGRVVTLTVTPASGYYIKASDIVVEKLVNTGNVKALGAGFSGITDPIVGTLYNDATARETANIINSISDNTSAYYVFTVPDDYDGAYVTATFHLLTEGDIIRITASTNLGDTPDPAKHYVLVDDVSASVVNKFSSDTPFTGIFEGEAKADGSLPKISDLSTPLFNTLTGTVKNIVLEGVDISNHTGNTGAIACTANGAARIYNVGILSGSVGGTGNTGGLVGFLDGTARVINCFSYANITGGTNKAGIVGNNNVASSQSNVATIVMNCMFYGTISSGGTISPIYGGQNIDNKNSGGLATYNYYLYRKDLAITDNKYNCALAVEEKFLTRFELFRQLVNSNKKLASIYATGSADNADQNMMKWVLETADRSISGRDPYPYPILKAQGYYPSIVNLDIANAPDSAIVGRNNGGKLPSPRRVLYVNISGSKTSGGQSWPLGARVTRPTLTLERTDKDTTRFNFNYDKVQLPYYNEVGEGNYTGNRVVTGWKITSITGGTAGTFKEADEWGGYNFADRNCTNKDLYSESGRVFSQGAYFDVPYGVTAITIEPYWGVAAYVSDQYYDVVYKENGDNNYSGQSVNVTSAGLGTQANNNTNITINGSTQKVYTSINNARSALNIPTDVNSGTTVYDYAVVLVGNVHQAGPLSGDYTPYTITSVDLDNDNEPDYSFIFSHHNRQTVSPIRFDFLNVVGTAQAQKPNGTSRMLNVSIFNPKGWFEVTNTCSIYFVQFEGDNGNKTSSPIILLGGAFDQFTSTQNKKVTTSQQYIHIGGNAWFKAFGNGTHGDGWSFTSHVPVSVTGGDFDGFYLSGVYRPDAGIQQDNAECYISSGRFKEVAGAAQQMIDGDVHWQIYNADITNFYGGGINAAKPITGDITVDIFNSHVDTYCGGPKFGDMQKSGTTFTTTYSNNKEGSSTGTYSRAITKDGKVTTNATGCWFNKFFGAGYGGTSYSELKFHDNTSYDFNTLQNNFITDRGKYFTGTNTTYKSSYGNKGPGVATDFSYEFFVWSKGQVGARFYVKYASFSLAQCNDVESKLKKCVIETNFYGGGSIGKVAGTAKSELENCEVKGSVYGGGYSASLPTIPVRAGGFTTIPKFNNQSGMFEPGVFSETKDFDWTPGTLTENESAIEEEGNKHDIYTDTDLTTLGEVAKTELSITGTTTVAGSVYGGGEESNVAGNTQVDINGGTISQNVYGGGKGVADSFTCSKAMVGVNDEGKCEDPGSDDNKDKGTKVSISNGNVKGNVYGGGEVGRVEWNTQVNIGAGTGEGPFAPVVNGSVFGAGKGLETHGYSALVRGNSTVTVQGNAKVKTNVYGGGELATVGRYWVKGIPATLCEGETQPTAPESLPDEMPFKTRRGGKTTVIVQGEAQVGPDDGATETAGHVFGAGKGVTPHYVYSGDKANWSRRMVDYNSTKHTGEPGTTWDFYEAYTDAQIADANYPKYVWEYFDDEAKYFEFLQTMALVTGTDVSIKDDVEVKGSVYGGSESGYVQDDTDVKVTGGTIGTTDLGGAYFGNVYGGGKGDAEHLGTNNKYVAAGLVKGNTTVNISGSPTIIHNVYGGGAYGSVGEFTYDATSGMPTSLATENTGHCTVTITGGTFGSDGKENGMVFGSSRGDVTIPAADGVDPNDRMAWVYSTQVTIGTQSETPDLTTPKIAGSIYGSGENGHTFQNTLLNVYSGTIGITDTSVDGGAAYPYRGNVYGGGCGTDMYDSDNDGINDKYNPLAGIVKGTATVNISGGQVVHNVYGAGAMGSVGGGAEAASGKTTINVTGGRIGYDGDGNGHVFGAARGEFGISIAGSNLANVRETEVNINYPTTPAADNNEKTEQLIAGSVFGGGEAGTVEENVTVKMTGGTVLNDVYGGGALADTQTSNWDATANENAGGWTDADKKSALHTTLVRLTGGNIFGEAYGGGLGEPGKPAYVWGDALLDLNGTTLSVETETGTPIADNARGCAVGQVFGCNNAAGSPKGTVTVHVYATQNKEKSQIANTDGETPVTDAKTEGSYDVKAVYGGGNLAAYEPAGGKETTNSTNVIIDGCGLTSIQQVYGGGNAASTPATEVTVNGTFEIYELFGGGNGMDDLPNGDPNPGANVGFYTYADNAANAQTPEDRATNYGYGSGKATVNVFGGTIHRVFGGSNTKGNVRQTALTLLDENSGCEFCVDEAYGGGKSAPMDAEAKLHMACIPGLQAAYGGAEKAAIQGNVTLNITNGTFDRVFGGNNLSGTINGSITVNIEEIGCRPIIIGELYGGGNQAGYSVYGYNDDDTPIESGTTPLYDDPVVNVKSFTSIGKIFGGGLGEGAKMVGNPTVNVNGVYGKWYNDEKSVVGDNAKTPKNYPIPSHALGNMGAINEIFGGGNEAKVIGNTTVNIATLSEVYIEKPVTAGEELPEGCYTRSGAGTTASPYVYTDASGIASADVTYYEKKEVLGADIRGNVYGGGNNAEVTGSANVQIGR